MALEAQLWQSLVPARYYFKDRLHMCRVENFATPGSPDVEGFLQGQGFFQFELKSEGRPANEATPVRFKTRPKQVEYARRRWAVGGACFWLLQVGHGSQRDVYMLEGIHGPLIFNGLTEEQLRDLDVLKTPRFDPVEVIKRARR